MLRPVLPHSGGWHRIVIDTQANTASQIRICDFNTCFPAGVAVAPNGAVAYVVSNTALLIIDTVTNTVQRERSPLRPRVVQPTDRQ